MKTAENSTFATYEPQRYKTFQGALEAFFEQECPQLGGARTRMTLVNAIFQMVQRFFPDSSHMKQGQIIWTTVHKDEKGAYGKKIKNSRLTPVVLDLIPPSGIIERANGRKLRDMKKDAAARICRQAFDQEGCMTLAELSILLKMAPSTASKYIREYEKEEQIVVPRRGYSLCLRCEVLRREVLRRCALSLRCSLMLFRWRNAFRSRTHCGCLQYF